MNEAGGRSLAREKPLRLRSPPPPLRGGRRNTLASLPLSLSLSFSLLTATETTGEGEGEAYVCMHLRKEGWARSCSCTGS